MIYLTVAVVLFVVMAPICENLCKKQFGTRFWTPGDRIISYILCLILCLWWVFTVPCIVIVLITMQLSKFLKKSGVIK